MEEKLHVEYLVEESFIEVKVPAPKVLIENN